ncbi:cell division cycle protein 20 homolog, partial [Callorhinchus milii]|uniref:cell division cycle protein 20 homolog n=1 Tax=Callorhinchus milii TaxID=7868 RepID=UPI001C3FE119
MTGAEAGTETRLETETVMTRIAETNEETKTPTSITHDYISDHKLVNLQIANHHSHHHQKVNGVIRQKRPREASSLNRSEINKYQDVNISGKCSETFKGHKSNLGDLSLHNSIDNKADKRHVPSVPMKILDAPGLKDDYYLNLIDWNTTNLIAIALSNVVYVWLPESEAFEAIKVESDYVSSVAWIKDRNNLALGTSAGDVQLWDVETKKRIRNMQGHSSMVGSLSWNDYILSSGSKFGSIHHHDVRIAQHHVGTLCGHTSQVCSLKWSPNGRFLASGGNDGLLNIWPNAPGAGVRTVPHRTIDNRQSAVKAINWCPWQPGILAVGGGMKDGHLRIWDTKTGSCVNDVDTKSQICSLIWLPKYKELVTGHGFPSNQVSVWTYPSLSKSTELKGHTGRVLHLAHSPDGRTLVSLAADE